MPKQIKPLEEEVIYSLASGTTIAPQQCTDWERVTSTLQGKQDWYNNGASDELEQFQSQLRKYGDNTTLAFDGTVPLNKSNSQYNTMVMEDEEVTESVATTSSNIGNPAPAVLSNNDIHQAEQKNRIGAQLKNFNSTTTIIKDTLTEEASNYTVSIQQKNNGCVIMVKYLDKQCEITPNEVDATSEDKLDYISNRLFDCFAVVVEDDDMKLIPDVANFINDKIHEVIQGGLDESFKRGKNMARKPTRLSEADGDEQANNMLSNPDVVAIINEIYAHRSDYGEDYEYLTPDEVAGVASGLGINNPSYNVVTVIATSIDDLIEELALNATPELLDIGASVQEPVSNEPTESEASLTNKGVEIKQESMQGRAKRRVVEARAFDDVIFEVNIKFYSDGYQRDTLEGTYKEVDESLQWFEEMWEDVTILTVYAFVDGNKVKLHLNDNFTNTKLMKYLLSGSDEDFMVLYNDWIKQGKPSTPPTKLSMSEAAKKNKTVEGWAKELGKPYAEIHKYWLKAEKAADDKLPEKQYYAEVNKIAQKMIGAKYGEFKKHAVKESMFSVAKQNGKLRIITESKDDLEFEIKLSVKGGAELLADLLAFAGMGDTLNVVDYLDDTLTVACDDEVYLYADAFADNIIDDLLAGEAVFDYVCNEQFTPNDAQIGLVMGESFDSVAKDIAHKEHIPEKNAAAILANSTRHASKAVHKANPKLNRVKG